MQIEVRRSTSEQPWTYSLLDQRQRLIADDILQTGAEGTLLLSELNPVITLGRRTPATDLLLSPHHYESLGIEVYPTDRGGLATYHGPGQWVLFVVDRLDRLTGNSRGVKEAVCQLLQIAHQVARDYVEGVEVREGDELGVWGRTGKIASVGVHVSQGILLHGIAINAFATPTSFAGLRPCGLDRLPQFLFGETHTSKQTRDLTFQELGEKIILTTIRRLYKRSTTDNSLHSLTV